MCPMKLPRYVTLIASQFTITTLLMLIEVTDFFTREDPLDEPKNYHEADNGGQDWSLGEGFFDASDASNLAESENLALSERLQAALVTKTGLSEDQFDHVWEEVNKEAEN